MSRPWIIERLDRKLMSGGLISYRRFVVSCSKMALDGSMIVEICDETMAKMLRKPVEMQGLFACMLFFFEVLSATLIFAVCFPLCLLSYRDGDSAKPHLNLREVFKKIELTRAILSRFGDYFGTPLFRRFLLVSIHN